MIFSSLPILPLFASPAGLPSIPRSSAPIEGEFVPGELLVKFKSTATSSKIDNAHRGIGAQKLEELRNSKTHRVKLPKGIDEHNAIANYEKLPDVEYAEPNYYRHALLTPNDTNYGVQWALPKIKAPQAWDTTTGNETVVAVVDSGVDYNHPDLSTKVIKGYDYINNDNDPMDDHGHGTHVAGITGAITNNAQGVAGVSWGAKLLAVKVLNSSGSGTDATVANGIRYAADNNAKIINLSLGGYDYSSTMADAVVYAQGKGCLVVAAAGNGNTSNVLYPAGYQNVIGVSATRTDDGKASYSNYGWYVDVAAPGGNADGTASNGIASTYPGNQYVYMNGTSMAAPHVAGLAALIATVYPGKTGAQLGRTIQATVDDLGAAGRDDTFGYGRINAEKAVKTLIVHDEENSAAATYSGTWTNGSSSNASGGAFKHSSSTGVSVTYSFNGTSVSWVAQKSPASGIAKVYIDGVYQQDVDLYGTSDHQQLVYTKSGLALGNHTIKIEVAGTKNASSSGYDVNVDAFDFVTVKDTTAPITTLSTNPTSPDGANGWFNTAPSITLTRDEPGTTYYQWGSTTGAWTTYSGSFASMEGEHTLYFYSVDTSGNTEAVKSQAIKVDTVAPTATITSPTGGTVTGIVTISGTATDANFVNYILDFGQGVSPASWTEITNSSTQKTNETLGQLDTRTLAEGDFVIRLRAFDAAAKVETATVLVTAASDTQAPVTTLSTSPTSPDGENGWFKSTTTASLTANEPATTYYQWDSTATANWTTYSGSFTAPEGEHTLYFYSVDTSNNTETARSAVLKVDTQKPAAPTNVKAMAPNDSKVFIKWEAATDNVAVIGYDVYNADNGEKIVSVEKTNYMHTGLAPNTTYRYYVAAFDAAGNRSPVSETVEATTFRASRSINPGTSVDVELGNGVKVSFSNVLVAGITSATIIIDPPYGAPDANFRFRGYHIDISTTANYSGTIMVTIPYDPSLIKGNEKNLKLMHWNGQKWEDVTVEVDTENNIIIGMTTSLSPFAVGENEVGTTAVTTIAFGHNTNMLAMLAAMLTALGLLLIVRRRSII
ncbi:MAG: S8 family serine peptidase [Actinobacteria bacterium]|nr:S8 family serine peptidase [Actinomycetota bacterium]